MCPNTKPNDLPLTHDVMTYLHNSFIKWIESLKDWIQVCTHLFSHFIPFLLSFHRRQLLVGSQLRLTFGLLTRQRHLSWVLQPIGSRVCNLENGRYMVRSLRFIPLQECIPVRILVSTLSGCASELVSSQARVPRYANRFSLPYLILMFLFSFFVLPQTIQATTTWRATALNPPSSPAEFTPSIPTNITSCASRMLSTSPSLLLWALSLEFPMLRLRPPSGSLIWPYLKTMSKTPTLILSPPFEHLSSRSSCLGNVSRKDVCTIPATSVPCECLFSADGEVATDRWSCLGAEWFEQLQVLKYAWWCNIVNTVKRNSLDCEEVHLDEYQELLTQDKELITWDKVDEVVKM